MIEAQKTTQEFRLNSNASVKISSKAELGANGREYYEHSITLSAKTVTDEAYNFKNREELENLIAGIDLEEPQTQIV